MAHTCQRVRMARRYYIVLACGKRARVDYIDWRWARKMAWHLHGGEYARNVGKRNSRNTYVLMHRAIVARVLRRAVPSHLVVDHRNRRPRDNRRANLRLCTTRTNNLNRRLTWIYWFGDRYAVHKPLEALVRPQAARKRRA
jgi:hypothetical protein